MKTELGRKKRGGSGKGNGEVRTCCRMGRGMEGRTVLCSLYLGQDQEKSGGIFNFEGGNAWGCKTTQIAIF